MWPQTTIVGGNSGVVVHGPISGGVYDYGGNGPVVVRNDVVYGSTGIINPSSSTSDVKTVSADIADKAPWPTMEPSKRVQLHDKCGDECFMRPKLNLKFPICRKPCDVSASGVVAANRRARLTKVYPDVVRETERLIATLGLTKKARKDMAISKVKYASAGDGKFHVSLVYQDGYKEDLDKPLTSKVILNRYGALLTPRQKSQLEKHKM